MNEVSSSVWSGKYLVTLEGVGPIPEGTMVYCFIDYGDWFKVLTRETILGVNEFKLDPVHRVKFRLLS